MGLTYLYPCSLECDVCGKTESFESVGRAFYESWARVMKHSPTKGYTGELIVCRICIFRKLYWTEKPNPALYGDDIQDTVTKWGEVCNERN